MPRKLALESQKLKLKYIELQERYGEDIFSKSANLYHFCFVEIHSYQISIIKRKIGKDKVRFPFQSGGEREWAARCIHFYFQSFLRGRFRNYWQDAVFIIYFTYFTGFNR